LQLSYLFVHILGVLADLRKLELHEPETEGDDPPNDYHKKLNRRALTNTEDEEVHDSHERVLSHDSLLM